MEESNLEQSIEALQDALKAADNLVKSPALKVTDQTQIARNFLSAKALAAMAVKRATTLIEVDDNKNVYQCVFFAVRTKTSKIEAGVREMAEIANDLAEKGLIHSILAPIGSIDLVRSPGEVPTSAVFFYPLVPIEKVGEVKFSSAYSISEGDTGQALESFQEELPAGEFFAVERISHMMSMIYGEKRFDISGTILNIVNDYLKILPPGTKFLGANQCAITDLSLPYELKFFNPLLARVKRVDLDYIRCAEVVNDKLEQFNLFTGIRYYGADGKRLFYHGKDGQ